MLSSGLASVRKGKKYGRRMERLAVGSFAMRVLIPFRNVGNVEVFVGALLSYIELVSIFWLDGGVYLEEDSRRCFLLVNL